MEKESVKLSLGLLILVSVALPSGSFMGLPVKHLAFIIAASCIIYNWIRYSARIPPSIISIGIWSFAATSFFAILGATNGYVRPSDAVQEAIGVFTTVSVALMALTAIRLKWMSATQIISYGIYGALIFSFIKNCVATLMALGVIGFYEGLDFYMTHLNAKFVSSEIVGGLVRVNLIIYDFFVLLMLSICLLYPEATKDTNKTLKTIFIFSALTCIFYAFSRYLFAVAGLVIFYAYIFKFKPWVKVISVLLVAPLLVANAEWISEATEQRFVAQQNIESDEKRGEQTDALLQHWAKSPILGHGLGAYAPNHIRDQRVPYSYEVQWAGFLLKTGVVGIALMLSLALIALYQTTKQIPASQSAPLAILLAFFLLGGLTNQYLITSGSGVYYLTILCAAHFLRETKNAESQ